jgi:hypothetical protein
VFKLILKSFSQRPLTWLFWIAAACLDAVAVFTDHEASFANALVLGQTFVASGWLVLGKAHRLARAGVLIATLGALSLPDFIVPRLRGGFYRDLVWPHVLAMLVSLATATATMSWIWWSLAKFTSSEPRTASSGKRQFPLAELFGWMIIVAAGSLGIRWADFSLQDNPKNLALGLALASLAAAMMAMIVGEYGRGGKFRIVLASMLLSVYLFGLLKGLTREELGVALGAFAFVAVWALVMKMDNRHAVKSVHSMKLCE